MTDSGENIRVIGRFRPLNERERALGKAGSTSIRFGEGGRTVWLGPDESSGNYTLDAVLPPEATQQDLFNEASGLVDSVMQGYNGTLLAYGQVSPTHHRLRCAPAVWSPPLPAPRVRDASLHAPRRPARVGRTR